jgi:hypothetical protein
MSGKTLWTVYVAALALLLFAPLSCAKERVSQPPSASQPQSAHTLLDAALKKAKAQRKAVFVFFDASW